MNPKRQATLALLIPAAVKCFAEGLDTVRHISKEAGLPPATIHYYFKTKDELYEHCVKLAHTDPTRRDYAKILVRYYTDSDDLRNAQDVLARYHG